MKLIGTSAMGIKIPVIAPGDNLSTMVADAVAKACEAEGFKLCENDIIGVTESVVAKSQNNYASLDDVAADIKKKFPSGTVGVVFPIMSRNRFINILKGIAAGAENVAVLLNYPGDEVGNPILDISKIDEIEDRLTKDLITGEEFNSITDGYSHPFTGVNYISLYESCAKNVKVYVSNDPRSILKLTKNIIVGEIHSRFVTKKRLLAAGAEKVCLLSDILNEPVNGSGYNPDYGILGSNLSTDNILKLFPRDCNAFVEETVKMIKEKTGVAPEFLIYGDGAFKDPLYGIWELADPVVSPGYTKRLGGQPNEIKLKYIADNVFSHLSGADRTTAVTSMIKEKDVSKTVYSEGTTPRKYADLLGSLCDLMSGSGDKGTPVILIRGYFDNYAS